MKMWLYQLSRRRDERGHYLPSKDQFPPSEFRSEIQEEKRKKWPYGKVTSEERPQRDDVLVFFYAPAGEKDPGIYGWAVVKDCNDENKKLDFVPKHPTKNLMRNPWWDDNVKDIVDTIRGGSNQGTLWLVEDVKLVQKLRAGITERDDRSANDVAESLPLKIAGTYRRFVRDTKICDEIKRLYRYRCQVCGVRLKLKPGDFYAEGHHLQPLGGGHKGLDVKDNILCLCPNHHVLFDNFSIRLDPLKLRLRKHDLRQSFVYYHNAHVGKS